MKTKILLPLIALTLALIPSAQTSASSFYNTGSVGVDVSYPNCGAKLGKSAFGIVGVTGGLVYSHNPCLADQAKNFSDLSLYINTGLNASSSSPYFTQALAACDGDASCAAYTYGHNAALDALSYAATEGVSSERWWLDAELENTWDEDVYLNQRSLQGAYDALKQNGAAMVGAYSTTAQWGIITGGWQNDWPNWGATTWTKVSQAKKYCQGHEFTGGPTLLIQFQDRKSKLDSNVAC